MECRRATLDDAGEGHSRSVDLASKGNLRCNDHGIDRAAPAGRRPPRGARRRAPLDEKDPGLLDLIKPFEESAFSAAGKGKDQRQVSILSNRYLPTFQMTTARRYLSILAENYTNRHSSLPWTARNTRKPGTLSPRSKKTRKYHNTLNKYSNAIDIYSILTRIIVDPVDRYK